MGKFKPTKKHIKQKLNDQVILLNDIVKIKLAPSSIHGVGVFAMRDFKKGEKLYTDIIPHQFDLGYDKFRDLEPEIRDILLGHFPLITKGSHFMYPVTKFSAFLNHSDNPNLATNTNHWHWYATRDVKEGEELTGDYNTFDKEGTSGISV